MTETKANYKATFILDTRGREESVDDLIDGLKNEIASVGAEVTKVENQGRQDFARASDPRYTAGVYASYEFAGDKSTPTKLIEKLRLNKLVSHKIIQRA